MGKSLSLLVGVYFMTPKYLRNILFQINYARMSRLQIIICFFICFFYRSQLLYVLNMIKRLKCANKSV